MRITSGILGGREIDSPATGVRPTKEVVREALFSSLGTHLPGARFLDLFAGSGAVGLEAWSRGAKAVTLVEKDSGRWRKLRDAVRALKNDQIHGCPECVRGDVCQYISHFCEDPFDLVFADPPYETDLLEKTLQLVRDNSILADDGILIYEMRSSGKKRTSLDLDPDCAAGWGLMRDKIYGESRLLFLRMRTRNR